MLRSTTASTTLVISASDGQRSRRYTGLAVGVVPDRIGVQVDVHRARERVRDDERRRREVVHAAVGMDPAFEVAVAGEHRAHREVVRR